MSLNKVKLKEAQLNLLLTIDGQVYAVAMDREKLETIDFLVKGSTAAVVPTKRNQDELLSYLGLVNSKESTH